MRVLFLDYDGVLHPLGLRLSAGCVVSGETLGEAREVDFFCWVPLLETLLEAHTDVRLVVHSSWREYHTTDKLGAYLGPLLPRFLGATAGDCKRDSIEAWLAQHPEVTTYRVLDDDVLAIAGDATRHEPLGEAFIACDWQTGIAGSTVLAQLERWLTETKPVAPALPACATA